MGKKCSLHRTGSFLFMQTTIWLSALLYFMFCSRIMFLISSNLFRATFYCMVQLLNFRNAPDRSITHSGSSKSRVDTLITNILKWNMLNTKMNHNCKLDYELTTETVLANWAIPAVFRLLQSFWVIILCWKCRQKETSLCLPLARGGRLATRTLIRGSTL